jgi:hypothetical protein
VRAGDSGGAASSSGRLAGFVIGRRSPLWVRSTATRPCAADNPAPVVGNEGNTIRAVVNNARKHSHDAGKTSSRSAHRISPKRLPHPPCPECAIDQAGHGAHKQRARGRMVPLPHRPLGVGERSQLRDRLAREAWPRSFNVERRFPQRSKAAGSGQRQNAQRPRLGRRGAV